MSAKNNKTGIMITALFILISAFLAKYSTVVFFISIFLICALNAGAVCNFGACAAAYINIAAVVFCIVTSFIAKTLALSDAILLTAILLPGIAVGISFKKKFNFKDTMIACIGGYFLVFVGCLAVCKYGFDIDITEELRNLTIANFDDQISVIKSIYPDASGYIESMEYQIFNILYVIIPGAMPFAVSVVFMFAFLLQYALCKITCTKYLVRQENFKDGFDTFKLGIVTNTTFVLMLLTAFFESSAMVTMICTNLALFILVLYFTEALSFIEYKLKERAVYPAKRLAIIIAIIVVGFIASTIFPVVNFLYVFIFLGFLDSIFDFRKLNEKKVD